MKKGKQTFLFEKGVYLKNGAAIVGEKEGRGPLKDYFDMILQDDKWGEDSFEKAERKMFKEALETAKLKAGLNNDTVDMIIGGDLLNQIISASFASKDFPMPFLGVYGAVTAFSYLIGPIIGRWLLHLFEQNMSAQMLADFWQIRMIYLIAAALIFLQKAVSVVIKRKFEV